MWINDCLIQLFPLIIYHSFAFAFVIQLAQHLFHSIEPKVTLFEIFNRAYFFNWCGFWILSLAYNLFNLRNTYSFSLY